MQRRLITVILFAVLAAAVSSTLLYKIITANSPGSKTPTARIFVATRDLDAGGMIGVADIRTVDWPVTDGNHWVQRQSDIVGRALLTPVAKDEPFSESRLAAKGAGAGAASRIPPGMRLIAVHVDELTGLSRFILPGMHVDVISTGSANASNGQGMVARTILQNIEVFSSGQSVERDARDKAASVPVFDLLVTPQQAMALSQAVAQTRIELVLRNPLDKANLVPELAEDAHFSPVPSAKAMERIFSPPQTAPQNRPAATFVVPVPTSAPVANLPPPPPPAPPTVEVIQGTKRTVSAVAVSTPESKSK